MSPKQWFHIYTTIGEPSSKVDEFLAVRSQFDSDHGVDFSTATCCQSATFVRPLFALYCTLVFLRKIIINNAAFRHRRGDVYAARVKVLRNRYIALREQMVSPLYGRLIARWRHDRWCHRYGKGSCFNSTLGHTGSLLAL